MIMSGTSRFWILVVITACTTVCPASEPDDANLCDYYDDFQNSEQVENDCFYHSIFWPQGAFPPSEPYLYHKNTGQLGFGGYNGQAAQLVYRFPFKQEQYIRTVSGELIVNVKRPYENWSWEQGLEYSLSSDGVNWSSPITLPSVINTIELESIRGICYIKFSGIGVVIDDIKVVLNPRPADHFVPSEYPTIQDAIDDANDGDIIEVASRYLPYTGRGFCDIDFKGKSVTIYGEKGSQQTTIECMYNQRGFYFHNGEDSNSVLRGFTIKNGRITGSVIPDENQDWNHSSSHPIGGGIYCEFSSPSIVDCIIQSCSTEYGGAIGLVGSSPYIADCVIQSCKTSNLILGSSGYGAGIALIRDSNAVIVNTKIQSNTGYYNTKGTGIYCYKSKALFANCEIKNNSKTIVGDLLGGGIYAGGFSTNIELRNCVIADNTALKGAGIYTDSIDDVTDLEPDIICNVRVINCTIANNKISGTQSDTIGGGIHSLNSNIVVKNSIIWGNDSNNIYIYNWISDSEEYPVSFSDFPGGDETGDDNIDVDPCFASPSTSIIANRDYHLKSKAMEGRCYNPAQETWIQDASQSECIDAGDPDDDIGPEPFPHGKRINMGAYGGTEQASKNVLTQYIFHVAEEGNDNNSGLSREDAFSSIQKAIDMSIDGDVVMIWPGTYYEEEEISFLGKAITVQSASEAAMVVVNHGGYAFSFHKAESHDSVLRNLIIAYCNGEFGGAIYCGYASPTLTNLTIVNNSCGIMTDYTTGAQPIVKNCIFKNNNGNDYNIHDPYILRSISYCRLDTIDNLLDQDNNITNDPRFVNNDNDFRLKSNSKCIDAGEGDFSREPQPNGSKINMGAYGGTPYATKSD